MNEDATDKNAIDPFFHVIPGNQWNATIGRQGDEHNYLDGYIEAAIELASAVIDRGLLGSRDTLVMPILFNGRHALELTLKFATNELLEMEMIKTGHKRNHDIHSYWNKLRGSDVGDRQIRETLDDLKPYVESLAKIDNDGQELRYPINRNSQTSLKRYALANIGLIRNSLESMSRLLNKFRNRILDLRDERRTGTYTRDCSRFDLVEIAQTLGDYNSWPNESFSEAKKTAMMRYGISSRVFSQVVKLIQTSRPLAALVGLENPLKHIQDNKFLFVMENWCKLYPVCDISATDMSTRLIKLDLRSINGNSAIRKEMKNSIDSVMTIEEIADLETVFYIGRDNRFGEMYEEILENTLRGYKTQEQMKQGFNHLFEKTNLLDNVIRGCDYVGLPSLAEKLAQLRPTHRSMRP